MAHALWPLTDRKTVGIRKNPVKHWGRIWLYPIPNWTLIIYSNLTSKFQFVPDIVYRSVKTIKIFSSNGILIGAMSSTVRNISVIPAFRKLETFDSQELAINLSTLLTNKNDETSCIYTVNGKFERRQCNFSLPAVVVCSVRTSFDGKNLFHKRLI